MYKNKVMDIFCNDARIQKFLEKILFSPFEVILSISRKLYQILRIKEYY